MHKFIQPPASGWTTSQLCTRLHFFMSKKKMSTNSEIWYNSTSLHNNPLLVVACTPSIEEEV